MEPTIKRAVCTALIKLIHACTADACPRFDACLSDLSICIYRQPRKVERNAWEVWQYVLHARERAGEDAFLEVREAYDEKALLAILGECREYLACTYELKDGKIIITI